MTARTLAAVLFAVLVAFVPAGAFAAGEPEPEMRGYVTTDGATVLLLTRMEMDTRADASLMVKVMDDALLEETLDVTVIDAEPFDRDVMRATGTDAGTLFAVYDRDMGAGLVVVAHDGRDLFLIAMFGDDLDGGAFALITIDAIAHDLDVTMGRGWLEVPMDDEPAFVTGSV